MKIINTDLRYTDEPLVQPFGFKGAYFNSLWQSIVRLDTSDSIGLGLAIQSVLWSDENIFAQYGFEKGNELMLKGTKSAIKYLKNTEFSNPSEAINSIFPYVFNDLKEVTNRPTLRETFALNSLVAVDSALWQLYGKEQGTENILDLVDSETKNNLSGKTDKIFSIPLLSYATDLAEIKRLLEDGYFFFKIKIGADPDKDGNLDKMLDWDKKRLEEIHKLACQYKTPFTDSGNVLYYLDANGRYDSKERLNAFLEFADSIGALERISLLEEPFPEDLKLDVSDIPVRIAADESAHSNKSAIERMDMGYTALALKPIAKTISKSIEVINEAAKRNIPCFCADLTVVPYMVEINKNIAARMNRFPDVKIAIFESNGPQNYPDWPQKQSYHPMFDTCNFMKMERGIYSLDDEFYNTSGGMFRTPEHYLKNFK